MTDEPTDEQIDLPPLEAAVCKYLEAGFFVGAMREFGRKGFPFPIPSSEDQISAFLEEIHSLLGKDSPIRTAEEVEHLIRAEITQLLDEFDEKKEWPNPSDPVVLKHLASVFAAKLREPLRTWSFVTQIAECSQFELHQSLGQSDELTLVTEESKNRLRPMLQGRIEASNELLCRSFIEDLVRSIDGLSFALGLAEADPISLVVTTVPLNLSGPYDRELPLHPAVGGLCPRVLFRVPADLNDLERRQVQDEVIRHRFDPLVQIMRSNQERARELRNAGALLFDAYAARDDGSGIAMALMALEAMLLEKADSTNTIARLSEAVTYRLGTTASKRVEFRRKIKGLYGVRSVYIHTGRLDKRLGDRRTALAIAKEVLRKELEAFVFEAV